MTPTAVTQFTKHQISRTAARRANDHLANAWQAARAGDRQRTHYHLSAAAQNALASVLIDAIDAAQQMAAVDGNDLLVKQIERAWRIAEVRCITEEIQARYQHQQRRRTELGLADELPAVTVWVQTTESATVPEAA